MNESLDSYYSEKKKLIKNDDTNLETKCRL